MKLLLTVIATAFLIIGCQKKKYKPYIGTYSCSVDEHLDSTGYNWDTTYHQNENLFELNGSEMGFREFIIPYKYIDKNGFYEATHLVPGLVWGRQLTLTNNNTVEYYHHEATSDSFWYIRFTGTLVN